MRCQGLCLAGAVVMAMTIISASPHAPVDQEQPLRPVPVTVVPAFVDVRRPMRIRSTDDGRYWVLGADDHSVAEYDSHFRFLRRVGTIGENVGEFYRPSDFTIDGRGRIWVAEDRRDRVQVLEPDGRVVRVLHVPTPRHLATLTHGRVAVVSHTDKVLARVFDDEGRELAPIPLAPSEVANPRTAFQHRSRLAVLSDGTIFAAFLGLTPPTVRRIEPSGSSADWLIKVQASQEPSGSAVSPVDDPEALRLERTLNALAVDAGSMMVWVAPTAPELHVYRANGAMVAVLNPRDEYGRPHGAQDLTIAAWGDVVMVSGARAFHFKLPGFLKVQGAR